MDIVTTIGLLRPPSPVVTTRLGVGVAVGVAVGVGVAEGVAEGVVVVVVVVGVGEGVVVVVVVVVGVGDGVEDGVGVISLLVKTTSAVLELAKVPVLPVDSTV